MWTVPPPQDPWFFSQHNLYNWGTIFQKVFVCMWKPKVHTFCTCQHAAVNNEPGVCVWTRWMKLIKPHCVTFDQSSHRSISTTLSLVHFFFFFYKMLEYFLLNAKMLFIFVLHCFLWIFYVPLTQKLKSWWICVPYIVFFLTLYHFINCWKLTLDKKQSRESSVEFICAQINILLWVLLYLVLTTNGHCKGYWL